MLTWSEAFKAWAGGRQRAWLAYKIGVSVTAVHFYFNGSRPYAHRRKRIERLSGGAVPADLPAGVVVHQGSVKPNKSSRKAATRSVQNARKRVA